MQGMVIRLDKVSFSYGRASENAAQQARAIDGVSLKIERGEFVAIIGPNGSGKSTLAKLMNALLLPTEGSVVVNGLDTRQTSDLTPIRQTVGMVFQNPDHQLVASLVENDVAFGPENLGVPQPELRRRVTDALAAVGLSGFEKRATSSLSGGQKQRVAIAGVLAMQPQVIVLDEASAMLDPAGGRQLMSVLRELHAQGMTIVTITHDLEEAAAAERVVVLDAGKVVMDGPAAEVLTHADELEELGLSAPFAVRMARRLQSAGINVSATTKPERLKEELCSLASSR